MSRHLAATVPVALLAALVLGSSPAHAAGCASVSVSGDGVSESGGVVTFDIAAAQVVTVPEVDAAEPFMPSIPHTTPVDPGSTTTTDPGTTSDAGTTSDFGSPGLRSIRAARTSGGCDVTYATQDGTAHVGEDYTERSGSVSLSPGQHASVQVPVTDDAVDEPAETFALKLGDGSIATATIDDDDAPPALSVAGGPVAEGGVALFQVSLSHASAFPVSVDYATADSTATAGSDYVAQAGTVTFAPGTTTRTVPVGLLGDSVAENDERFALALSSPQGATIAVGRADALVHDDDAQPSSGDSRSPQSPAGPRQDLTPPLLVLSPPEQHGATIDWLVTCPATEEACAGTVRLTLLGGASRHHARASAARAGANLGSARYRLKGGQQKKVRVKLNKRGRRALRKRGSLRVRATFETRDSAGNRSRKSQIITLHSTAFRHS